MTRTAPPPGDLDLRPSRTSTAALAPLRRQPGFYLWPLLILVLAAILRFYLISTIPFGWHYDESANALLARDIAAGKQFPIYYAAYTGREVLFIYLEALAYKMVGVGIVPARLVAAGTGLLTVALTIAVGKEFVSRRMGLWAAAFLAVSLWHVIFSRNDYRVISQPLVQLLAIWFFLRGLRGTPAEPVPVVGRGWRRSRRDFILAGIFLGLTLYTYTGARFFPFVILGIAILALLFARKEIRRLWPWIVLSGLVALAVFAPLGIYFLNHPGDFLGRSVQVSVFSPAWSGGDPWGRLWQSVRETAGMFTYRGDPNFRFNYASQPVFGPLEGALFYAGLLLCLWLALRTRGLQRVLYASMILWLIVMLLPMTFSAEGLPYYPRAAGVLPVIYFFPALTVDAAARWAEGHLPGAAGQALRLAGRLLLVVFLGWLAFHTYQQYFVQWHNLPQNDDDRRVAPVYVADYLRTTKPPGELYISTEFSTEDPTLALLSGLDSQQWAAIHWFSAGQSLPLPPPRMTASYVMMDETHPQPVLLNLAPGLEKTDTGLDRFGRPVFEVYRWTGGQQPVPPMTEARWSWEVTFPPGDAQGMRHSIALPADFGHVMALAGYARNGDVLTAGASLNLVLFWQLRQRPERQYSIFAHLLDAEGRVVGEYDANRYQTNFWRAAGDEMLLSYYPIQLKPGTAPGPYQLEIGVYHQPTGERLPVYEDGQKVADRLLLRPVEVR